MAFDRRFRPKEHLRSRSDFARVYGGRCRRGDDALTVYVAENGLGWSRLGLSVGKRVGGAVSRNKIRRRIREAFRISKHELPEGLDIICVATAVAADKKYDIAQALPKLVSQAARRLRSKPENRPPKAESGQDTPPARRRQ